MEPPENYIITTFSISMDEWKDIFPWFENLSAEIAKPKSKRGRKQKPKQMTDKAVEMKASN